LAHDEAHLVERQVDVAEARELADRDAPRIDLGQGQFSATRLDWRLGE
jgi:hypothetical protein